MEITVKNLGPIKEATIRPNKLTLFVGANGTGKSYLAKVLYGLQLNDTFINHLLSSHSIIYQNLFQKETGTTEELLNNLRKLTPNQLQEAIPFFFAVFADAFKSNLSDFFKDDQALFDNTSIAYTDIDLLPLDVLQESIEVAINVTEQLLQDKEENWDPAYLLLVLLIQPLASNYGLGSAHYLPASRSNLMLTYKEIYRTRAKAEVAPEEIADKLFNASKGGKTRTTGKLFRFDKPTEDFIDQIFDLDTSQEQLFSPLADELQQALYKKDSLRVEQNDGQLPSFRYHVEQAKKDLRLHMASSMVTETAPLWLCLKYWIGLSSNDLLIIDEPESHLHPEAQRVLVNILAKAVNQGLRVILITHSPYILACVNNLIKLGNLLEDADSSNDEAYQQKIASLGNHDTALKKAVAAYHFKIGGTVENIVKSSSLIDEREFTEPFDHINDAFEKMNDIEWNRL